MPVYIVAIQDDADEDFEEAFALGATGVMTDSPSKLRAFLDRTGRIAPRRTNYGAANRTSSVADDPAAEPLRQGNL